MPPPELQVVVLPVDTLYQSSFKIPTGSCARCSKYNLNRRLEFLKMEQGPDSGTVPELELGQRRSGTLYPPLYPSYAILECAVCPQADARTVTRSSKLQVGHNIGNTSGPGGGPGSA
jgi:hypothetical protein